MVQKEKSNQILIYQLTSFISTEAWNQAFRVVKCNVRVLALVIKNFGGCYVLLILLLLFFTRSKHIFKKH